MDENRARGATVIPALGPRGEGWTALQVVLMFGIVVAAWTSPAQDRMHRESDSPAGWVRSSCWVALS